MAPAKDGRPFELALVKAMIAAANADGHIEAQVAAVTTEEDAAASVQPRGR